MVNRFRHLGDRQLAALYLLMEAIPKGKKAVHLSSGVLQYLLGVERVHTQRVRELASSFAPFLSGFKIHDVPGYSRTVTFFLPGVTSSTNSDSLKVTSIPKRETMEKSLGFKVKEIETETRSVRLVKKSNF